MAAPCGTLLVSAHGLDRTCGMTPRQAMSGHRLRWTLCGVQPLAGASSCMTLHSRTASRRRLLRVCETWSGRPGSRAQAVSAAENVEFDDEEKVLFFPPPTRVSAPGRVVAIGDLHGDLAQTTRALHLAGVIGLEGNRAVWTGGNTTLVQLGDILDRGDEEIGILFLLQRLAEGAEAAGGAVYVLNGNHEILNVSCDFSYVTAGAFQESARFGRRLEELFGDTDASGSDGKGDPKNEKDAWQAALRARVGLFAPGGPLAQQFARNSTVLVVNDTVFAHGGLLPTHVRFGLERINEGVSRWMLGDESDDLREALEYAKGPQSSVVWNRQFAREKGWRNPAVRYSQCGLLRQALELIPGAKRLVVGHTPQRGGCNCECDGLVWRVDVGLSRGVFGNPPQVLEIDGDRVRVLIAAGPRLEKTTTDRLAPPQWLIKTKLTQRREPGVQKEGSTIDDWD